MSFFVNSFISDNQKLEIKPIKKTQQKKLKKIYGARVHQQNKRGEKFFKIADPIKHNDLFVYAEKYLKKIENKNLDKFDFLIKLHDRAEIIYSKND